MIKTSPLADRQSYPPEVEHLFGRKSSLEKLKTFSSLRGNTAHINKRHNIGNMKQGFPLHQRDPLALDAEPQHALPVGHVGMLLHKVHVGGQQELPAPVDPWGRHVLQEVLHIIRRKLCRSRRNKEPISCVLSGIKYLHLLCESCWKLELCAI